MEIPKLFCILFLLYVRKSSCLLKKDDCYSKVIAGIVESKKYEDRVVGGQITGIRFHPYQVYVHPGCGGSIIGIRWILTAAHCYNPKLTTVYVGSSYKMRGIPYKVKAVIEMPKLFLSTNLPHYDFMLLELENDLVYGPTIQPIRIGSEEDIVVGKYGILTGYGRTKENGTQNLILREVALPIIDLHKCKHRYAQFNMEVLSTEFCAGYDEGGRDGCQGDSGGPFTVDGKLIGVTSYGRGCARPGSPGVFASVPKIRNWIYDITGIS